jgi:hypothetical protein
MYEAHHEHDFILFINNVVMNTNLLLEVYVQLTTRAIFMLNLLGYIPK